MKTRDIKKLVDSTADAAFAVDCNGIVMAWNQPAAELLGVDATAVLGRPCGPVIQGKDECGPVCSKDCTVLQACRAQRCIRNFDLQVQTAQGPRWCNVSVLIAGEPGAPAHAVHIIRAIDMRKKLELLVRDFIVSGTGLPTEQVVRLIQTSRSPAQATELTKREIAVLSRLAKGLNTDIIAAELFISRTTVNNHVQHILRKLDAHTRLEAIRRAERAGLI